MAVGSENCVMGITYVRRLNCCLGRWVGGLKQLVQLYTPIVFFSTDRSMAVPLFSSSFMWRYLFYIMWRLCFLPIFFLISSCFGASERLCFVIVAFPGYNHSYIFKLMCCLFGCYGDRKVACTYNRKEIKIHLLHNLWIYLNQNLQPWLFPTKFMFFITIMFYYMTTEKFNKTFWQLLQTTIPANILCKSTAGLKGRLRPAIDLCRMLTGIVVRP